MKKFISGFLVGVLIMCMLPVGAAIQQYTLHKTNMKVTVEGKEYKNTDYPILSYKAETYIPLGTVSKALGIDSVIDLKKKTLDIKETAETDTSKTMLQTTTAAVQAEGYTGNKIDGFSIFQKDGKEYVDYHNVSSYFIKKSSNGYWLSETAEKLDKPIKYKDDTKYWKTVSFQILHKTSNKLAFKFMPCEYIWIENDGMFSVFITLDNYKQNIQPLLNMTIQEIWEKAL